MPEPDEIDRIIYTEIWTGEELFWDAQKVAANIRAALKAAGYVIVPATEALLERGKEVGLHD